MLGVVYWLFVILVLILVFVHQRRVGVLDVVMIEGAVKTAGRVVAVKTMLKVTGMAAETNRITTVHPVKEHRASSGEM